MFRIRNSNILKLISKYDTARNFSKSLEPVKLAYASYESTQSPTEQDPSPLLVHHGIFGSKTNWKSLCKHLHNRTQRKVIAVDARNHGDSPHHEHHTYEHLALDLKEFVRQQKLTRVSLLGHSMGGRAVMYFALKYPELVEKVVVVDISPVARRADLKTISGLCNVLQNVTLPQRVTMSTARIQTDLQISRFVKNKGLRNFLLTNLVQNVDGSYRWRLNLPALQASFDDLATFPSGHNLKFEGPVLFVAGGESRFIQKADHVKIKRIFSSAQFKYVQGAGHWIHSEQPEEFLKCTVEFLNKT